MRIPPPIEIPSTDQTNGHQHVFNPGFPIPAPPAFSGPPPSPRKRLCLPQPHNRRPNRSCSTMASVASAARVSSECRDGSARKSLFSRFRTHHNTGSTSPRMTSHSRSTSSRRMTTYGGAPRPFSSPPQSMAGATGRVRSGGAIVGCPVSRDLPRPATPSSLEIGPPPAHSRSLHPHPQAPTKAQVRGSPKTLWSKAGNQMGRTRAEAQRRRGQRVGNRVDEDCRTVGAVFFNCLGLLKTGNPGISPKGLDQRIAPIHSHTQLENALAPLRLCARFSGSGWGCFYLFGRPRVNPPIGSVPSAVPLSRRKNPAV